MKIIGIVLDRLAFLGNGREFTKGRFETGIRYKASLDPRSNGYE